MERDRQNDDEHHKMWELSHWTWSCNPTCGSVFIVLFPAQYLQYLDIYTTPSSGLGSSWSRATCSPPAHPPGLPWWQGGTQCTQVGGPYNMFSAKFYVSGRQHTVIHPSVGTGLSTRFQLMPQHLAMLGYSSHMVGKWHLGFCHPSYLPTRSLPDIWSFVNLNIQEGLQLILWLLDG